MRRQKRRPMHYYVSSLYDGTVIGSFPERKPAPKVIKRDGLRIDEDGVCRERMGAGTELSDVRNETRTRFQDIIAVRLNTRRAIREMILPSLTKLQTDMDAMRSQLDHIQQLLRNQTNVAP